MNELLIINIYFLVDLLCFPSSKAKRIGEKVVAMTTDEAEKQQRRNVRPSPDQDRGPGGPSDQQDRSSPEDQVPRPRTRGSGGRGLSRLFSSFRKQRSLCSEEERDGPGEQWETKELKAPIADPEPELRAEEDTALDLQSLSSAEIQLVHVDQKEDQDTEKDSLEEEEAGRGGQEDKDGEGGLQHQERKEGSKTRKAGRQVRTMHCKVTLLDDTQYECELEKHSRGQDLFMKVCDHLNLLEKDYYGLAFWESPTTKTWLDFAKEIRKQTQGICEFTFNVKFYPPDPTQLTEDITRYYLCLQLRKDIFSGRLPCSFVTLAVLGSYAVQSELGEYDPDLHGPDYTRQVRLAPRPSRELEEKVMELHRTYKSMIPAQADIMFLENAKKLSMYGLDFHPAKDLEGVDIMLGVCSSGLMVYKDKLRINRFPWPKVLKISYKRSNFYIKVRPSELEHYESTIGFKLPNCKASKRLWKVCVEHHTFFRLSSTEAATTPRRFLALGSKFRYSGRTQAQTRQASSMIDRPAPLFQRSTSKRASRSLDEAVVKTPDRNSRPVSAPIMSPVSPVSLGEKAASPSTPRADHWVAPTPSRRPNRLEDRRAEIRKGYHTAESPRPELLREAKALATSRRERREISKTAASMGETPAQQLPRPETEPVRMRKKRAKKIEGETIYIRHSNLMLEDVDKTQGELMRHHASISELKRSFMEAMPEQRPSEWDKRLSSQSPFRSITINGQLQPSANGSPLVKKMQTVTISDITNNIRGDPTTKEVPIVHTETRTITYESPQTGDNVLDRDGGILLSAQTISSDTVCTTTTTQITKTVKGGISETRIEKRIVITGDMEIDHDKALAQAIKEAKEQHPDMSVTRVVVHQETEITPDTTSQL
ncbi:protein 4.1-like isoform X2 [Brienomyrus brachyistius]|uniref:protein 4.1-like isoform X2 n=1 Tax=Brienomyrus brachyistius TaxID=42636 RepID=UPI0020B2CB46|nr:protein 4.1-like isoform X2 [Brienomyrus brachyistius]